MARQPGLAKRIVEFYELHPDEWLTRADMAIKFRCSARSLENAMKHINACGRRIEPVTVWRWCDHQEETK